MDSKMIAGFRKLSCAVDHASSSRPPSAIATFSSLHSQRNSKHIATKHDSSAAPAARNISKPKSYVGPDALPTEILLLIFQFVFETCVDWHKVGTLNSEHTTVWLEDDPLSPSLFPYSLASVCVRWSRVLSDVAVYWTRQVIIVDSLATSPIVIQTLLRWVGNHPLQLVVTRYPGISVVSERVEYARLLAVLKLLQPRIHQIWSLTINVRYNSSLTALWRERGDAQRLGTLTLMSDHSGTSSVAGYPRFSEHLPARNGNGLNMSFPAHFLEEVTLGGQLFTGALVFKGQNLWFFNITSLVIRGCAASDAGRISLHNFVTMVQACGLLQKLTVEDASFVNDVHPSHRFHIEVPVVFLRNITDGSAVASIMSQTFGSRLKEIVTVSNCPFDGFGKRSSFRTIISSTSLVLEEVNASTAAMQQLVCFWNGESLSLIDCPGVSTSFLRRIPTEETPRNLRHLRIVDCENVGVEGLIALVKLRELHSVIDMFDPHDPDEEPCVALVELHVHGRGPSIGRDQAVWFAEHVDTFSWDTVTSDGTRYTWDAFARELIVIAKVD